MVSEWFPSGFRVVSEWFPSGFRVVSEWFWRVPNLSEDLFGGLSRVLGPSNLSGGLSGGLSGDHLFFGLDPRLSAVDTYLRLLDSRESPVSSVLTDLREGVLETSASTRCMGVRRDLVEIQRRAILAVPDEVSDLSIEHPVAGHRQEGVQPPAVCGSDLPPHSQQLVPHLTSLPSGVCPSLTTQ